MKRVKKLVIVGGGTAGWIAASWFARRWSSLMDVTVIDKSKPERVGVGEATLLSFPKVMQNMGYRVEEWASEIDATFKAGILFPGWGKEDSVIWHPFGFASVGDEKVPMYDIWTNFQDEYDMKDLSALYRSAMNGNIEVDYIADTYAYQIDCGKLVGFLQRNTTPWCEYIQSDVKDVIRNGDEVEKLILEDGSEIESDLFIDCTGWKQLLIGSDNIDLNDRLFIDSALAGRVKYQTDKEQHPYTNCEAVEHGWIWKIPTKSRIGTGYCFNRSITPIEEAKQAFVNYWNNRITEDELKLLDWKPQMCKQFWKGNVVSIGLSAGFIEPLESTGLALMIRGCETLEESIYGSFYNPKIEIPIYNDRMFASFETAIDFVNMHYAYSERKGKFWDYVRANWNKSGMQQLMEDYIMDPELMTQQIDKLSSFFGGSNWHAWLLQLMPVPIPQKTYWHKMSPDIVPRFNKYIDTLDNNVLESTSQKVLLKEWYGQKNSMV
tara:strand:- start:2346 stop:3821 length:1476 start_codon:yes stop_codon:yes gene_type:complete